MTAAALHWLTTFASPYHLAWFILSMSWVLVALGTLPRVWPRTYGCLFHALVAFEALLNVVLSGDGPVFSVHCIWFNGLMAVIYWAWLPSDPKPDRPDDPQ